MSSKAPAGLTYVTDDTLDEKALAKANIKAAIDDVANSLGNTPTICRKCYVHPALLEAYEKGDFQLRKAKRAGLSGHEASVLNFLTPKKRSR